MKVFATLLILTCASKVYAGVVGAAGGGDAGDDDLKSIKTTILSKDGILGEIFGAGGVRRRRGRLLDMLGGGGGGGGGRGEDVGGLFGGVIIGLAQDIMGAIKAAKLELIGNLVGNLGGGSGGPGLDLGALGLFSGGRSDDGPLSSLGLGGGGGGGFGEIKSTISDLKSGLFQKEGGALSGLFGGGGLGSGEDGRSGRLIPDLVSRAGQSSHNGGLTQHSMCNFFCMLSRLSSVQENCLKRNKCLRVSGLAGRNDLLQFDNRQDDELDAIISEVGTRKR